MTRIVTSLAFAAFMGAATVAAFAQQSPQPQQPPEPQQQQMGEPGQQMEFRHHHGKGRHGPGGPGRMMIDANADNVIGDDEAASVADFEFMRLDRDRSNSIEEAEFTARRGPGGWWRQWTQAQDQGVTDGLKAKFAALDADKNGGVSKAEYFAEAKSRLAAADADKDGKVTPWEFRAQN
jgi:EF hand